MEMRFARAMSHTRAKHTHNAWRGEGRGVRGVVLVSGGRVEHAGPMSHYKCTWQVTV